MMIHTLTAMTLPNQPKLEFLVRFQIQFQIPDKTLKCKRTTEEVLCVWSNHRISSIDLEEPHTK